ncbi:MAG: hypothetical protein AAFX79_10265 [Planctomycetota bacterium]
MDDFVVPPPPEARDDGGMYVDVVETGRLLAAALSGPGPNADAVRGVLVDSIQGVHEVGRMGRHAIVAMLGSERYEDWGPSVGCGWPRPCSPTGIRSGDSRRCWSRTTRC